MEILARPIPEDLKGDEVVFPSGLRIHYESDLTEEYFRDRETLPEDVLIDKWSPLCPELRAAAKIDILAPPTLLKIAGLARHFGVPDGVLFMQLWNHGLVGLGKHNGCVYFLENESNL